MDVQKLVTTALAERYRIDAHDLHALSRRDDADGNLVSCLYHGEQVSAPDLLICISHDTYAMNQIFRFETDQAVGDWLASRARLLNYLERRGYPAPRVIPTREGALVERMEPWHLLITT